MSNDPGNGYSSKDDPPLEQPSTLGFIHYIHYIAIDFCSSFHFSLESLLDIALEIDVSINETLTRALQAFGSAKTYETAGGGFVLNNLTTFETI
jgi:hypothetical protein